MPAISVVIIALNEEKNMRRCLYSVQEIADEIVVIDSGSTDETVEICEQYGARIIQHPFQGFAAQKNFGNTHATYDHILSMDADEALSQQLFKSIKKIKKEWKAEAYVVKRLTNYCGKWIRHCGWYPDPKIRLFNRKSAVWKGNGIHEEVELLKGGAIRMLHGNLLHFSFYTIEQHITTINRFSTLAAKDMYEKGKSVNACKRFFKPVSTFIRMYLFRGGFRDGFYGFVICVNSAHSSFLKLTKLQSFHKQKHRI